MKNSTVITIAFLIIANFVSKKINCQVASNPPGYSSYQGFVVHEWGTFTTLHRSDGKLLSGLQKEEESLPGFVGNLSFNYKVLGQATNSSKGYYCNGPRIIKGVTVKMETPVIYFYSPDLNIKNVSVDVSFKNGTISQWYPGRRRGENSLLPDYYTQAILFSHTCDPTVGIVTPPVDFSEPHTGSIGWDISILPNHYISQIISPDKNLETPQWKAPRVTRSNLIQVNGDSYIEEQTLTDTQDLQLA